YSLHGFSSEGRRSVICLSYQFPRQYMLFTNQSAIYELHSTALQQRKIADAAKAIETKKPRRAAQRKQHASTTVNTPYHTISIMGPPFKMESGKFRHLSSHWPPKMKM